MGKISNIEDFNKVRLDRIAVKNKWDEIVISTHEEVRNMFLSYMSDELNFFNSISNKKKKQIDDMVAKRLEGIEKKMTAHISDKIDKLVEKILSSVVERELEGKITEKVRDKINKLL